jgi:hypothetical protein
MGHHADSLVSIPVDDVELEGMLEIPADASRVVVFAHGSGSSRQSPRNNFVADIIRDHGLGTLLFDQFTCEKDLHVVEGAGRRFEGDGELEEVADVASDWFAENLK